MSEETSQLPREIWAGEIAVLVEPIIDATTTDRKARVVLSRNLSHVTVETLWEDAMGGVSWRTVTDMCVINQILEEALLSIDESRRKDHE